VLSQGLPVSCWERAMRCWQWCGQALCLCDQPSCQSTLGEQGLVRCGPRHCITNNHHRKGPLVRVKALCYGKGNHGPSTKRKALLSCQAPPACTDKHADPQWPKHWHATQREPHSKGTLLSLAGPPPSLQGRRCCKAMHKDTTRPRYDQGAIAD